MDNQPQGYESLTEHKLEILRLVAVSDDTALNLRCKTLANFVKIVYTAIMIQSIGLIGRLWIMGIFFVCALRLEA